VFPSDDVDTLRERVQAVERALLVSTIAELAGVHGAALRQGHAQA
jgi:folate-dependent phosphoribosylglycinamide formyltransferase PurN